LILGFWYKTGTNILLRPFQPGSQVKNSRQFDSPKMIENGGELSDWAHWKFDQNGFKAFEILGAFRSGIASDETFLKNV